MRSGVSGREREPCLFTPGPLTTSLSTKHAMMQDLGSRDTRFLDVIGDIRSELLEMGGVSKPGGFEAVLMQGSGTFAVESVVGSVVPRGKRLLIVTNGAYGRRIETMADTLGIDTALLAVDEHAAPQPAVVADFARRHPDASHLAVVHHETTAGTLNPVSSIGKALREAAPNLSLIVDSLSGFGAYPIDMAHDHVDFLVSSANKCIEGVPGFAFCLARRGALEDAETMVPPRSLSLDLVGQWRGLEANGQFRFTPPTHALLAFHQALREHREEGGCAGRLARYEANATVLQERMAALGFVPYVDEAVRGAIITTYLCPDDPRFVFADFYKALSEAGHVIYPGKMTEADCFRIGTIGRLFPRDVHALVDAVERVLRDMDVDVDVRVP